MVQGGLEARVKPNVLEEDLTEVCARWVEVTGSQLEERATCRNGHQTKATDWPHECEVHAWDSVVSIRIAQHETTVLGGLNAKSRAEAESKANKGSYQDHDGADDQTEEFRVQPVSRGLDRAEIEEGDRYDAVRDVRNTKKQGGARGVHLQIAVVLPIVGRVDVKLPALRMLSGRTHFINWFTGERFRGTHGHEQSADYGDVLEQLLDDANRALDTFHHAHAY